MDAPPYGRAVSDAPPHSGLSPIAVFRHYSSRHLICIAPFFFHAEALRTPARASLRDSRSLGGYPRSLPRAGPCGRRCRACGTFPSSYRSLAHLPATMASSDSSLRFRYNEVSRVPLLNFPDTRSSYVPRGRLRVASRSPSATCPPLRSGAFRFDYPSRFDSLLLAS